MIEKLASLQQRKKHLSSNLKSTLHLGQTAEEEKREVDVKDSQQGTTDWQQGTTGRKEGLPGEGKRVEEMEEDERVERGVRLVQRAFARGLRLKEEGDGDGEK